MWTHFRRSYGRALTVTQDVVDQIHATVGTYPAETGGMLGGDPTTGLVTHFMFDDRASRTRTTYSPDVITMNRVLANDWNPVGVRFLGFVHSHPPAARYPSQGDAAYASSILGHITDLQRLAMPIVLSEGNDVPFELLAYTAHRRRRGVRVVNVPLVLADAGPRTHAYGASFASLPEFARVSNAYDLALLQHSRAVVIGCGGSAEFVELLARAGLGDAVLIDGDRVSASNVATQQVYQSDIDKPKVDVLRHRLKNINPQIRVHCVHAFSDALSDCDFQGLIFGRNPESRHGQVLLCGMTDSFDAQARVNRLALQFRIPSLCAQVYPAGLGAEITFTHPDVTTSCHRCVLRTRYDAYLRDGFRGGVGSVGTPISTTVRLNALKFVVAMSLLHYGTSHDRWGQMLQRIGNRNLIQLRMHPDLPLPVFQRVFSGADQERLLCDDTVWLPQDPESGTGDAPKCPECGGTGDLSLAAGRFSDTRVMRR